MNGSIPCLCPAQGLFGPFSVLWGAMRVCSGHEMSSPSAAASQGEWGVISYQPGSLQDQGKIPPASKQTTGCRYLLVVCAEFPWTLHLTQILNPPMDLAPFWLPLLQQGPDPGLQRFVGRISGGWGVLLGFLEMLKTGNVVLPLYCTLPQLRFVIALSANEDLPHICSRKVFYSWPGFQGLESPSQGKVFQEYCCREWICSLCNEMGKEE